MIQIGSIMKVLPGADYGGKFTGYTGKVEKYFGSAKNGPKVGIQFDGLKNDCESGLFWFNADKVELVLDTTSVNYMLADTALTSVLSEAYSRRPRKRERIPFPNPKRVITSGPKTIVLWEDGTKTIVTCGESEINDTYAGFCAAVVKKLFGSTSRAKKVLNAFLVDQNG